MFSGNCLAACDSSVPCSEYRAQAVDEFRQGAVRVVRFGASWTPNLLGAIDHFGLDDTAYDMDCT